MNFASFPIPKKTLHSVPFFALLLAVASGWLTLAYFSIPHFIALAAWVEQKYTGLDFFIVFLVCFLVLVPFLLLWAWAAPRVHLRLDRITNGQGWGGWVYVPVAPATAPAQTRLLRTRRWHLCWQIPLAWLAGMGWALLVETQDGWNFHSGKLIPVLRALGGGLVLGLLELYLPFMLIARAFPRIRKMVREYAKSKYPNLPTAKKTHPDEALEPSADLIPRESNDDAHCSALPDDPAQEVCSGQVLVDSRIGTFSVG